MRSEGMRLTDPVHTIRRDLDVRIHKRLHRVRAVRAWPFVCTTIGSCAEPRFKERRGMPGHLTGVVDVNVAEK